MNALALSALVVVVSIAKGDAHAAAANETRALQSGGTCFAPEYHFNYPGNDITNVPASSFEQCCDKCYEINECGAYTWTDFNGGTCWLKAWRERSEWKGARPDGSAHTVSAELNRCGRPVVPNQDLIGLDGASSPAIRPEGCCQQCFLYKGCKGFAWNDFNGGTCWFKGGPSIQTVYKQGVSSILFG